MNRNSYVVVLKYSPGYTRFGTKDDGLICLGIIAKYHG